MKIEINDDFSLEKIVYSGQCFRPRILEDGSFLFITGRNFVRIKHLGGSSYDASCTENEWNHIWSRYFDLNRSYSNIRAKWRGKNTFIDEAMKFGKGIRILRQDPFETLISFIISQRKSIPAIRKCVEHISTHFGTPLNGDSPCLFDAECRAQSTEGDGDSPCLFGAEGRGKSAEGDGDSPCLFGAEGRGKSAEGDGDSPCQNGIKAFPTVEEMCGLTEDDLKDAGLGYRLPFVLDAVRKVNENEIDLEAINELNDEELVEKLKTVYGVGNKVANCVALFAYLRTGLAPVDVWIQKAIDDDFGGINPFPQYGDVAGIMQQYVFYYKTKRGK